MRRAVAEQAQWVYRRRLLLLLAPQRWIRLINVLVPRAHAA
ncbi:MAG TPA: hypothetical protein VFE62_17645 [Gemmataceae bacterium]|nr:hypothetical protein [Gemmataceae bacterium]